MNLIARVNSFFGYFLINDFTGKILKIFKTKLFRNGLDINISEKEVSNSTAASIYFNSYESAEIRFVKKYLDINLPIIELGSSIGIVGCIAAKKTRHMVYGMEANPNLLGRIEKMKNHNKVDNYTMFNYALSYDNVPVFFEISKNNVLGKIVEAENSKSLKINSITYDGFIEKIGLKSSYNLISDIEGAEFFFIYAENSLINCNQLIIELHDFEYKGRVFKVNELEKKIEEEGFDKLDQYGNCYVFAKKEKS